MTSLYKILKSAKLGAGAAQDFHTAIMAQKMPFAKRSGAEHEYTGAVPVTFTANGQPLLDYLISGNEEHNGTPTPDNLIIPQGTGERTGNLYPLDASKLYVGRIENDGTIDYEIGTLTVGTDSVTYETDVTWRGFYTDFIQVNENETLTFSPNDRSVISCSCNCYDEDDNFLGKASALSTASMKMFTLLTGTKKVRISMTSSSTSYTITKPMLNTGSTALPYEPYGIKIPISSANALTSIYLGEVPTTRKVKKLVLTGEEECFLSYSSFRIVLSGYLRERGWIPICSHYKGIDFVSGGDILRNGEIAFLLSNSGNNFMYICDSSYTTVNDFKSYLAAQYAAGTPVTVWYVLATPVTGIVNEPLMRIGDYADTVSHDQAGVSIPTANGSTTLDVETAVKPSEIYIKYKS